MPQAERVFAQDDEDTETVMISRDALDILVRAADVPAQMFGDRSNLAQEQRAELIQRLDEADLLDVHDTPGGEPQPVMSAAFVTAMHEADDRLEGNGDTPDEGDGFEEFDDAYDDFGDEG